MGAWQVTKRTDFMGGENLRTQPEFLEPNQVARAINCVLTPEGHLQTREGKTKVNDPTIGTGAILSIHRYTKEAGTQYLVVQHGTSLYSVSWNGTDTIASFGAAIKTGLTAGSKLRGVVWKDKLILTNGVDTPFTYDGTTCSNLATAPVSPIFKVYANKLWGFTNNLLKFSALEDPTSWDALDVIKVRDADGDTITGISPQVGGLVIFKRNSVFALYGTTRFDIRVTEPISQYIGNMGYDSYIDDGVFLGKDNLYRFTLNEVAPFPETHTSLIQLLTSTQKTLVSIKAHPYQRRAYVLTGNSDGDILVLDGKYNGAITRWQNLNAKCFETLDDKTDDGSLLIGDATTGIVYKNSGDTDDGTVIITDIKTGYNNEGLSKHKLWRYIAPEYEFINATSYQVTIIVDVDYEDYIVSETVSKTFSSGTSLLFGTTNWGAGIWGSNRIRSKDKVWLFNMRGDRVSFNLRTSQRIRLAGFWTKFREVGNL